MKEKTWRPRLSRAEQKRGWVFFALYLLAFPYLTSFIQRIWMAQGEIPAAETNLVYYAVLLVLMALLLHTFLRGEFDRLLDDLPGNLSAGLMGFALWLALTSLVRCIPLPLESLLPFQWRQEYIFAPRVTVLLVVVLIPLIEEIFYRGLVFGVLRQKSRPLAYGLSCVFFALASVWRYALNLGDWRYLLTAIQYLPAALALAWAYERGGSVWTAVALRIAIHAAALFLLIR